MWFPRYLKCLQKVMVPPSCITMGRVLASSSYCASSRSLFFFSLSCFGLVTSGREELEVSEGGWLEKTWRWEEYCLHFRCFGGAADVHLQREMCKVSVDDGGA